MIQITCANCKNGLEVDDAFAGGVCRCQYCGTIQTVPKPGARPRAPGAPVPQAAGVQSDEPKALYQVKSRTGLSSAPSGLEELAEVVHSSGLSGSGLLNRSRPMPAASASQHKQPSRVMIYAGAGAVALLVILAIVFLLPRGTPSGDNAGDTLASGVPSTPQFAGIDVTGERVIYVVDRGDATASYFNDLKNAICNSVKSLGNDRRFAVMLWSNGSDSFYPRTGTVYATDDEVAQLRTWFDDVSTGRSTSVDSALKAALAQDPQEIFLVTAKSDQLEGFGFEGDVLKLWNKRDVKIHGVSIGSSPVAQDPLKKIALETKGKFVFLGRSDLSKLAD